MDLEAKIARSIRADLADSSDFDRFFAFEHSLGKGSDGEVSAFLHRPTNRLIAVKTPHRNRISASMNILEEAKVLTTIGSHGKHENVNHMVSSQSSHGVTLCRAIFLEFAEFGSLWDYRAAWFKQEARKEAPIGIPESTVWKLFKDITLALDFLHNECGFIHRDVKSENILVARSPTDCGSVIPEFPVFKLGDFSRAVAYPLLNVHKQMHKWAGSPHFAPPVSEREANIPLPARPAGDMWSFGATLQDFALGILPDQSRKAFVEQVKKLLPRSNSDNDDKIWKDWKWKLGAAYRPLNLQPSMLATHYDTGVLLPKDYQPFSDLLNEWYTKLWVIDPESRATSASLVKDLIPLIDIYISVVGQPKTHRADSMLATHPPVLHPQAPTPQRIAGMRMPGEWVERPSYVGNDYAALSLELRMRELD